MIKIDYYHGYFMITLNTASGFFIILREGVTSYNSSRQPPLGKQLAPPLQNLSADLPKRRAPLMSQSHRF